VESVLFGHERGAFTGADRAREGLIKQADGGTLFLDEIGELPPVIQKSFLRVLQERRFRPIGAKEEERSDFRLIAATNRRLDKMVAEGQFRTDLLFRVQALTIELPPLRERKEDIKDLTVHSLRKCCERYGTPLKGIAPELMEIFMTYEWPGNVRELANTVDSAICTGLHEPTLYPKHLPTYLRVNVTRASLKGSGDAAKTGLQGYNKTEAFTTLDVFRDSILHEAEQQYLTELLTYVRNDIREACRISGLSRSRLYALLKKHGLARNRE